MNYNTELEVQTAIYNTLSGDATLAALVTGIYDHVPQETTYPYVVIADMMMEEFDTQTWDGALMTLNVHVWSRKRGRKECMTIFGHLRRLLHDQDLVVSGHCHVLCQRDYSEVFLDPDGVTRHGVMRFRILVHNE